MSCLEARTTIFPAVAVTTALAPHSSYFAEFRAAAGGEAVAAGVAVAGETGGVCGGTVEEVVEAE